MSDLVPPAYLDCCDRPALTEVRRLYQSSDDVEALRLCSTCGTYWFYRFHEYTNWASGQDELTSWYAKLTAAEGDLLSNTADPGKEDLAYLTTRSCWIDDERGARQVNGMPAGPWS